MWRLRLEHTVKASRFFVMMQRAIDGTASVIWGAVGGKTKKNAWKSIKEIPSRTPESDAMSKELIKRGFTFVGSTICYAHMQATGMVNDHLVYCFRYDELP